MLRRLLGAPEAAGDEARAIDASTFNSWADSVHSAAGVTVNEDNALALSAFYGSVRILSEGVAALPADSFQRISGTRKPWRPRPVWLDDPHPVLTWHEVMGQLMYSALVRGDAFAVVLRDETGRIRYLSPMDPGTVADVVKRPGGYLVLMADGSSYTEQTILHVPAMMQPGAMRGMSVLEHARESLGLGVAAQRFGSSFFKNGGTPKVVLSTPDKLTPAGQAATRRAWRAIHGGADSANDVAVLAEGTTFTQVSVPPDDAQFLQTRGFQVADVARFFGIPPHLIGDASGSTSWGSGLAEQSTNYVTHSLNPWVSRFEARLTALLRSDSLDRDPGSAFIKLNVSGLLRGDHPTRWETHRANVQSGLMTANEVRRIEDLPPIDGGDELLRPLNLAPADEAAPTTDPSTEDDET